MFSDLRSLELIDNFEDILFKIFVYNAAGHIINQLVKLHHLCWHL